MPQLVFCGLPGSGKTTLAERLAANGRGIRLCPDDWQTELGVDHTDTDCNDRLKPLPYRHVPAVVCRSILLRNACVL